MEELLDYMGRVVLCVLFIGGLLAAALLSDRLMGLKAEAISRGYATYDSNGQFTWREGK